jgi:glycosyltransferase involved in cell wall biosynthesis
MMTAHPVEWRAPTAEGAPALGGSVAYVLKGFPRLSELFIASEIHRLEEAGLRLHVYVIKQPDERVRHQIVDRIRARPEYLPATSSVSAMSLGRWLAAHFTRFTPCLRRVLRQRLLGVARAAGHATAQAIRARRGLRPRKVYVKEFLQAVALADRLLDAPDVQHLHAHFCHGTTTVTWLASLITGLPFSFTAHAKDLYCPALNPAGLLPRKLAAAKFAVTCTEANRQYLQRLGPTPVYRVYHGLNAELAQLLNRSARRLPDAEEPLRILSVGRLVRKKGFDVLIDACAILAGRGVPCRIVIVGEEGEAGEDLRRRIAAHRLDDCVSLAGPMGQSALYAEYRRASVFCLPCRVDEDGDRDGIPNVLVEAMACGLPVVTTSVSSIPELVRDGVTGLLVPPDQPEDTAAAILRLRRDSALAERLAREGEALVRDRFDGDRLVSELAFLFRKAVA